MSERSKEQQYRRKRRGIFLSWGCWSSADLDLSDDVGLGKLVNLFEPVTPI